MLLFLALVAFLAMALLCMSCYYYVNSQEKGIHNILTDEELRDMECADEGDEDAQDNGGWMGLHSFEETQNYVRSCREHIDHSSRPLNGNYKVVYNAVYFGKTIRSESQLQLTFNVASKGNNGWEISGSSLSGDSSKDFQNTRPIADGFLNSRGEMYWKLGDSKQDTSLDSTYRGSFDIRSSSMFDGEFQAGSAPRGRIVRMERTGEIPKIKPDLHDFENGSWGSADVEMVELDKQLV